METVGVQKDADVFRLAYLSMVNGKIHIERLETRAELAQCKKGRWMVTGVEGQELLMRYLVCPVKTARAAAKILPFQLEALLPYPLEKVILKPIYFVKEVEVDVLLFAVSKKNIEDHIARCQKEGFDPEWVSATSVALFRFASFVCPEEGSLVVFYVGVEKMQLVLIVDGRLSRHITLPIGSRDLESETSSKGVPQFKQEVDRAFCFLFRKKMGEGQKILFCGEKAKEVEALLNQGDPLSWGSISIKTSLPFDAETLALYAIPIGLGIDVLKKDRLSLQFRQGEFLAKGVSTSLNRGMIRGGALALACLIFGFLSVELFYHRKTKSWIKALDQIVAQSESPLPMLAGGLRGRSLEERLADFKLRLCSVQNGGPLFSQPPLVSDFLNFLSSHPQFDGVEIKQLDYTLERYPSLLTPKEEYRPYVRLVFQCSDLKKALAFRDAIEEDAGVIDREKEIKWRSNEDGYEMAFFLQHPL